MTWVPVSKPLICHDNQPEGGTQWRCLDCGQVETEPLSVHECDVRCVG